jgi:hypothetical protein
MRNLMDPGAVKLWAQLHHQDALTDASPLDPPETLTLKASHPPQWEESGWFRRWLELAREVDLPAPPPAQDRSSASEMAGWEDD